MRNLPVARLSAIGSASCTRRVESRALRTLRQSLYSTYPHALRNAAPSSLYGCSTSVNWKRDLASVRSRCAIPLPSPARSRGKSTCTRRSASATPDSEDDITDWLRRQLRSRLTIATTIDREVQVERRQRGSGTRIDLTVTAPAAVHPAAALRVITEAKLVTNGTLMTAMHDQLIRRYLIPTGL
jgi:hypothetical protein